MAEKILKKIALDKMDEIWNTREMYENGEYELAEKKMDAAGELLDHALSDNEELKKLSTDFGNAYLEYTAVVGEENFTRGFLEGVKFIMRLEVELEQIKK